MSQPRQGKQSSRWGSLLSGAVAGLESRLDTILAEEGAVAAQKAKEGSTPSSNPEGNDLSSKPSTNRPFSRLNTPSPRTISQLRSHAESPRPDRPGARTSTESSRSDQGPPLAEEKNDSAAQPELSDQESTLSQSKSSTVALQIPQDSTDVSTRPSSEISDDQRSTAAALSEPAPLNESINGSKTVDELQLELGQARSDFERVELRRQEETHEYLERIDALQSKLQYLAKEVTSSARQIASEASKASFEKKLAEKDEKIALLMDEGQKLSKTEVSQSTMIRNLRAKAADDGSRLAEIRQKLSKAEKISTDRAFDLSRLEADRKDAHNKVSQVSRLEKEVTSLRRDLVSKDSHISELKKQAHAANDKAEREQREASQRLLEEERRLTQSLRDDLANIKIENNTKDDRVRAEHKKAREDLDRETERNKNTEVGLRNEIHLLEARLEALREKSEESWAGTGSDGQANMMRQIETLQSQYAMAKENWRGIESSLQARLTALSKERDDATKHESEIRKKARESGSALRKLQDQFEETTQRTQVLEHELSNRSAVADRAQTRAKEFEKALHQAKADFDRERQAWNASMSARIEEEKLRTQQQTPIASGHEQAFTFMSPTTTNPRKTSTGLEPPTLSVRRNNNRQVSDLTLANLARPHSRRSSAIPSRNSEVFSPTNADASPPNFPNSASIPETPSINTAEQDDDDFERGSSPRRTVNDMLSASTAAAGPSVQLVERMSANVRRLESEKAAHKDELSRLSGQRDEARKEIVNLMREVDQKRDVDSKVNKLEQQLIEVDQRYQTTLEMLGEKSERVGELEADVADLKKIYKDLLDRTMK